MEFVFSPLFSCEITLKKQAKWGAGKIAGTFREKQWENFGKISGKICEKNVSTFSNDFKAKTRTFFPSFFCAIFR